MNFCAFDLEIAKALPESKEVDWWSQTPFGLACAATHLSGAPRPMIWQRLDDVKLEPLGCQQIVKYMMYWRDQFYLPLTWNGLGFDFRVLAEESGMWDECVQLALDHVDMMFQFVCLKGFATGLDRTCKAMGLDGKPEGMDGSLAVKLWLDGDRDKVIEYVASDTSQTLKLAEMVTRRGWMNWRSKSGNVYRLQIERWLTVRECLALPEPDNAWMDEPWPREKFYGWTKTGR